MGMVDALVSGYRSTHLCLGIPKFYRWLSERYPLVNQAIGSGSLPEFDNLYLDMNGIIHNCSHGNDPTLKLSEDEMFVRVFKYLEKLFEIVRPRKLLFMAVDGTCRHFCTPFSYTILVQALHRAPR